MYMAGAGASFGKSKGGKAKSLLGLSSKGEGTSRAVWRMDEIPGHCMFGDLGVSVGAGGHGGAGGLTELVIFGNGLHPTPISIDFSGKANTLRTLGLGAGGVVCYGHIYDGSGHEQDVPKSETIDFGEATNVVRSVHFRLGDSWLTEAGSDIVGELCAAELRSLQARSTSIVVETHADRLDAADRNAELTKLRAANVQQKINDTVGDQLAVSDDDFKLVARGEEEAAALGQRDGSRNASFRRADLLVNGHIGVSLMGAERSISDDASR